jgi:hypothetical protein
LLTLQFEGSASFLKKKKQKTSIHWSLDVGLGSNGKKFFASFFQKRSAFLDLKLEAQTILFIEFATVVIHIVGI